MEKENNNNSPNNLNDHQKTSDNLSEQDLQKTSAKAQKAKDDLNFAILSLDQAASNLVDKLSNSEMSIQTFLDKIQLLQIQQKDIVDKMHDESRVLSLLPQKVQDKIEIIAPKIAKEVGIIYYERIIELNEKFNESEARLFQNFDKYQKDFIETSKECSDKLASTVEHTKLTIEQKLTEFSQKLTKDAGAVTDRKNFGLLKNLFIITLFAGLVSSVTSYFVVTKFPRYIDVRGANDLFIKDSTVRVWEAQTVKESLDQKKSK